MPLEVFEALEAAYRPATSPLGCLASLLYANTLVQAEIDAAAWEARLAGAVTWPDGRRFWYLAGRPAPRRPSDLIGPSVSEGRYQHAADAQTPSVHADDTPAASELSGGPEPVTSGEARSAAARGSEG